jgi:hypothetical protein
MTVGAADIGAYNTASSSRIWPVTGPAKQVPRQASPLLMHAFCHEER